MQKKGERTLMTITIGDLLYKRLIVTFLRLSPLFDVDDGARDYHSLPSLANSSFLDPLRSVSR